mgnify:CR=1 FL=1
MIKYDIFHGTFCPNLSKRNPDIQVNTQFRCNGTSQERKFRRFIKKVMKNTEIKQTYEHRIESSSCLLLLGQKLARVVDLKVLLVLT